MQKAYPILYSCTYTCRRHILSSLAIHICIYSCRVPIVPREKLKSCWGDVKHCPWQVLGGSNFPQHGGCQRPAACLCNFDAVLYWIADSDPWHTQLLALVHLAKSCTISFRTWPQHQFALRCCRLLDLYPIDSTPWAHQSIRSKTKSVWIHTIHDFELSGFSCNGRISLVIIRLAILANPPLASADSSLYLW